MLVAEFGIGLHHYTTHHPTDRAWIYNKGIVGVASDILKLATAEKHYDGINRDARILRQALPNGLNMPGILHHRIVKTVFLPTIRQYLRPIPLMLAAENPAAVILYLKHYNGSVDF